MDRLRKILGSILCCCSLQQNSPGVISEGKECLEEETARETFVERFKRLSSPDATRATEQE